MDSVLVFILKLNFIMVFLHKFIGASKLSQFSFYFAENFSTEGDTFLLSIYKNLTTTELENEYSTQLNYNDFK